MNILTDSSANGWKVSCNGPVVNLRELINFITETGKAWPGS